jgi:formate hydrogenlyase transcriptional activator
VVAATNRPLEALVAGGTFRSDLYYRLNTFPILLPPLRERPEDIRPLVTHFLARHAAGMSRKPPRVPEEAWRVLETAEWPGNIRELENFIERALILRPGPDLVLPDASGAIADAVAGVLPGKGAPAAVPASPASAQARAPGRWDDEMRDLLSRALDASGGRIYGASGAAARLGLKPTTLQGKLKRYRLERTDRDPTRTLPR